MKPFQHAALLALLAFAGMHLAAGQEFKTNSAKEAQTAYEEAVKKLNAEYAKSLSKLQEKYLADLDDARKAALANRKLDEAQRILALRQEILDQLNEGIIPDQPIGWVSGSWRINYHPNEAERVYQIKRSGLVVFSDENLRGQLRYMGKDLTLSFGGESFERLTFIGSRRLLVEHYNPKSDYPKRLNQVGIGTRVLPKR